MWVRINVDWSAHILGSKTHTLRQDAQDRKRKLSGWGVWECMCVGMNVGLSMNVSRTHSHPTVARHTGKEKVNYQEGICVCKSTSSSVCLSIKIRSSTPCLYYDRNEKEISGCDLCAHAISCASPREKMDVCVCASEPP